MKFGKGERNYNNPQFTKFYALWKSMMARCYNPNSASYVNYGARGVEVTDEWKDFDSFISNIEDVKGFNLKGILDGNLQLDKDIMFENNRLYSKETCMFVSKSENAGNRRNNRQCVAVSPTMKIYTFKNRAEFCRIHNLNSRNVYNVLKGTLRHYLEWQFYYMDDFDESELKPVEKLVDKIYGVSPEGVLHEFYNRVEFAKKYKLSAPNILMVVNGTNRHHKYWKFYTEDNFDYSHVKPYIIKCTYNGITQEISDLDRFCKENGLAKNIVASVINGNKDSYNGWKFKEL